ncbi:MAG: hypothetical protein RBS80_29435 [Thermoguttaceae bacterium]|jgi:hypothetical protein|nr:hypothetical protein [Thermoguttaceae bacterium]
MSFDPSSFSDIAALAAYEQRHQMLKRLQQRADGATDPAELKAIQQELRALTTALTAAEDRKGKLPQCPVCGGRLEGQFRKCMHCACDLAWVQGQPCEPGKEPELVAMLEKRQEANRREAEQREAERKKVANQAAEARRQAEERRAADLKARGRKCARCGTLRLAEEMRGNMCSLCAKTANETIKALGGGIALLSAAIFFGGIAWFFVSSAPNNAAVAGVMYAFALAGFIMCLFSLLALYAVIGDFMDRRL